jgi:hypothetical protein
MRDGTSVDAADLFASADGADMHVWRGALLRDLMLPDAARLDDRQRAALQSLIRAIVKTIGVDLKSCAAQRLTQNDQVDVARGLGAMEIDWLLPDIMSALGDDEDVAAELIDRMTLDAIGERLPAGLVEPTEWSGHTDEIALSLRTAEARRRVMSDRPPFAVDLPAESHVRFVWWTAAAIVRATTATPTLARAVAEAAERLLSTYDEGDALESQANRMAASAGLSRDELGRALDHCIDQRRIVLMVALLGHAVGIDYRVMRGLVVDPFESRLWLSLRALDLPREYVARLGFVLAEADQRRDVEVFADRLDMLMAVSPEEADAAIAPLRLPQPLREAIDRLGAVR